MAYFPNGTAFYDWQGRHCYDCLNYRDNGSGSFGCAISDTHFLLDYNDGTNAAVLDQLITCDAAHDCRMRLTREHVYADELVARSERDAKRYAAAMAASVDERPEGQDPQGLEVKPARTVPKADAQPTVPQP